MTAPELPPLSPIIVIQCLQSNQGLMSLGKSLLQSFVFDSIISNYPQADLTLVANKVTSVSELAMVSENLKIPELKPLTSTEDKSNVLLAFVGAIYKEKGFNQLKEWLSSVIALRITSAIDFKDLQQTPSNNGSSTSQLKEKSEGRLSSTDERYDVKQEEQDDSIEVMPESSYRAHDIDMNSKKTQAHKSEALDKPDVYKKYVKIENIEENLAKEREEDFKRRHEEMLKKKAKDSERDGKRKREVDANLPLKNLNWQSSYSEPSKREFIQSLQSSAQYVEGRSMSKYGLDYGQRLPIPEELNIEGCPELPEIFPPCLPSLSDESLFEVLTHRSLNPPLNAMQDPDEYASFDNERLEFLGDAVLEVHTTEAIFVTYPQLRPAGMVHLRNKLVNTYILAYFADMYGLPTKLRMSTSYKNQDMHRSPKCKADVMEAYIGAVYRDREAGVSRQWLLDLLAPFVLIHLPAVRKEFEERNSTEVQGHWATAINKVFDKNKMEWAFHEADRNLEGVANWNAQLFVDGDKVADVCGSSKKNAKFIIAAMIAEHLKIPDAAGNYVPEGYTKNVKTGELFTANLEKLRNLTSIADTSNKKQKTK
ncbi:ribonuclease III [Wallemia mellicola]|uniref:Ribonuclease III n=1 Tax=Wallemia mellicola TaxID=1708541 RepID=A0A4T0NX42_9BASI|nr:ribonuclease III [Wallemia mellicola]